MCAFPTTCLSFRLSPYSGRSIAGKSEDRANAYEQQSTEASSILDGYMAQVPPSSALAAQGAPRVGHTSVWLLL